ncbi:uncharacterized protein LOC116350434 [Contarinia nasturtii]|uniref:uncharacterized protein LOC116350434 n=1 Tax=Contarinia nasturtii TaxID=265458 RepID=UPI0012D492DB|nr:uncharacterized protein LOC116350434 [Contarinia nasturtii]
MAIGLRWQTKIHPGDDIPDYVIEQTTFQYVSMKETLLSLFKNPSFRRLFEDFNQNKKHQCVNGVYKDYCCSKVYNELDHDQRKDAIFIQIGTDDFDVSCPVKSKSTIHKLTAVYFKIRNLPPEFESKLDCIFLLALCETVNIKQRDVSLNNIYEVFVEELSELQTTGLQIDDKTRPKVFLFDFISDNLGLNGALGFTECFIVDGMCRYCEMSKDEWRVATRENKSKLRTEASYQKAMKYLDSLDDDVDIDLKKSKGIKGSCELTKIPSFSIFRNVNVDLMHDILEELVRSFIENLMKYCSEIFFASNNTVQVLIRDFNYGFLFKNKLPSKVKIPANNLKQNATQ